MTERESTSELWLRRFQPAREPACRLVCFPHAGGAASFYFPVARALSDTVDVVGVQYPGRQDRHGEPCVDDIGTLADLIRANLRGWLDVPLVLFGHSMGAVLAFEVARRLERAGDGELLGLVVSGRRAPSIHREEWVHLRDDAGLLTLLREMSGTDERVLEDDSMVRMILPVLRSDYRAIEKYRYQPGPPLSCPVGAFTGDADPRVSVEETRAWREHTTGDFSLRTFPGGHFYLAEAQAQVIAALGEQIALFRRPGKASVRDGAGH